MGNKSEKKRLKKEAKYNRLREAFAAASTPTPQKVPAGKPDQSYLDKHVVWSLDKLDHDADWYADVDGAIRDEPHHFLVILTNLHQSGSHRKWREILSPANRKHDHFENIDRLSAKAKTRLDHLKLGVDQLFRFRLDGKKRIWGIREGQVFHVIWWDPYHQVRPIIGAGN